MLKELKTSKRETMRALLGVPQPMDSSLIVGSCRNPVLGADVDACLLELSRQWLSCISRLVDYCELQWKFCLLILLKLFEIQTKSTVCWISLQKRNLVRVLQKRFSSCRCLDLRNSQNLMRLPGVHNHVVFKIMRKLLDRCPLLLDHCQMDVCLEAFDVQGCME